MLLYWEKNCSFKSGLYNISGYTRDSRNPGPEFLYNAVNGLLFVSGALSSRTRTAWGPTCCGPTRSWRKALRIRSGASAPSSDRMSRRNFSVGTLLSCSVSLLDDFDFHSRIEWLDVRDSVAHGNRRGLRVKPPRMLHGVLRAQQGQGALGRQFLN